MTSINKEISLSVDADRAWALLRDPGAAHRAFPGVVAEAALEGDERAAEVLPLVERGAEAFRRAAEQGT